MQHREDTKDKEFTLSLKRVIAQESLDKGIANLGERVELEHYQTLIRALVNICTIEQPVYRHPKLTPWNLFKHWFFPKWLKRKTPVKMTEVVAIHKLPEVSPPRSVLGHEYVHLKTMDYEKFLKKYGLVEEEEHEEWETDGY